MSASSSPLPSPSSPCADTSPAGPVTVYRPNQRHELSWLATWVTMARNTWRAREMIRQMLVRDLTAQFKKSHIGVPWMLAGPIMSVIPWLFAAKVRVYNPGETEIPLAVYLVVGRTMWGLFSCFYSNGTDTLQSGGALLMQVTYPHEAMLVKQALMTLANFVLQLLTCLVVMGLFGIFPGWGLLFFPLTILPLFFLGAAMGLVVGMISVVAYDLNRVIGVLWGFLMWTTPLLYSNQIRSPILQVVIKYNPLTYLVCSARDVLVAGHVYNGAWGTYLLCCGAALILFLTCLRFFHVSEQKLIERML